MHTGGALARNSSVCAACYLPSLSSESLPLVVAQTAVATKASRLYLAWVTTDMLLQTVASTVLAATVYLGHSYMNFTLSEGINARPHMVTGIILGMLLVARVIIGVSRMYDGISQVQSFAKSCRTLAVLSVSVGETLTISAAAEVEKKATSRFRYELVRLLNMSFFCYTLMLQGMKLAVPPTSLRATEDTKLESEILSAVENPTVSIDTAAQQRRRHSGVGGTAALAAAGGGGSSGMQ